MIIIINKWSYPLIKCQHPQKNTAVIILLSSFSLIILIKHPENINLQLKVRANKT